MTSRPVAVVVAALVVMSTVTIAVQPAAGATTLDADDSVFTEAVLEDKTLWGGWSPSEEVVRYGAESYPGWVVKYRDGNEADLRAWVNASDQREIRSENLDSRIMVLSAPPADVGLRPTFMTESLADKSYVEAIDVNRRVSVDPITSTELKTKESWDAPSGGWLATWGGTNGKFSADGAAWSDEVNKSTLDDVRSTIGADNVTVDGSGVRVAVLDTGFTYRDEWYGSRVPKAYNALTNETVNVSSDPANATETDYEPVVDGSDSRHGSHVAMTIAGNGSGPNETGIAPGVTLLPVKVLGDDGSGTTDQIARGLEWACEDANADVISMSLGSPQPSTQIEAEIVECLEDNDVSAVVVAAGNNRMTYRYVASPGDASIEGVVTVAASDARAINESESAYFSAVGPDPETGAGVDVAAPGLKVVAAVDNNDNRSLSGTSMATPVTTGSIALLLEADSSLVGQPVELATYLTDHAEPMRKAGTTEVGAGRVNADHFVNNVVPSEDQEAARNTDAEARDKGNEALSGSVFRNLSLGLALPTARTASAG